MLAYSVDFSCLFMNIQLSKDFRGIEKMGVVNNPVS